jgi:hypothetical protein
MSGFYYAVSTLRDYLKNGGFVNTVSTGDIFEVDLAKQTIYPYVHIIVNNSTPKENSLGFNLSVLFMDIVDISKTESVNVFDGNDNLLDVLNSQLAIASKMVTDLRRGDLYSDLVQIDGDPLCEPFTDRFENKVAGWTVTFDLIVPNDMTICD